MKIQRWLGLVTAASMLQLSVKVAYAACESASSTAAASHHSIPSSAIAEAHHHEAAPEPGISVKPAGEGGVPDQPPAPLSCCQAMASCGGSLILNQRMTALVTALATAPAIAACGKVPHGRVTAPEPPPPKA